MEGNKFVPIVLGILTAVVVLATIYIASYFIFAPYDINSGRYLILIILLFFSLCTMSAGVLGATTEMKWSVLGMSGVMAGAGAFWIVALIVVNAVIPLANLGARDKTNWRHLASEISDYESGLGWYDFKIWYQDKMAASGYSSLVSPKEELGSTKKALLDLISREYTHQRVQEADISTLWLLRANDLYKFQVVRGKKPLGKDVVMVPFRSQRWAASGSSHQSASRTNQAQPKIQSIVLKGEIVDGRLEDFEVIDEEFTGGDGYILKPIRSEDINCLVVTKYTGAPKKEDICLLDLKGLAETGPSIQVALLDVSGNTIDHSALWAVRRSTFTKAGEIPVSLNKLQTGTRTDKVELVKILEPWFSLIDSKLENANGSSRNALIDLQTVLGNIALVPYGGENGLRGLIDLIHMSNQETFVNYVGEGFVGDVILSYRQEATSNTLRLGTGSEVGAYYPVGKAIASQINESGGSGTMRAMALPTDANGKSASVKNIELLCNGELELAIVQSDDLMNVFSYSSDDLAKLRADLKIKPMAGLYIEKLTVIADNNLEVRSVQELAALKNRKIRIGYSTKKVRDLLYAYVDDGTRENFALMDWVQINPDKALAAYESTGSEATIPNYSAEGSNIQGIDAYIFFMGHPNSLATGFAKSSRICRILDPSNGGKPAKMEEGFVKTTLDPDEYKSFANESGKPIDTIGAVALLVAHQIGRAHV